MLSFVAYLGRAWRFAHLGSMFFVSFCARDKRDPQARSLNNASINISVHPYLRAKVNFCNSTRVPNESPPPGTPAGLARDPLRVPPPPLPHSLILPPSSDDNRSNLCRRHPRGNPCVSRNWVFAYVRGKNRGRHHHELDGIGARLSR